MGEGKERKMRKGKRRYNQRMGKLEQNTWERQTERTHESKGKCNAMWYAVLDLGREKGY